MGGHNDLTYHGEFKRWHSTGGGISEQPSWRAPRVVRVFRWAMWTLENSSRSDSSSQDYEIPSGMEERVSKARANMEKNVLILNERIQSLGGRVYMLTYILPGKPPSGLEPYQAEQIIQGRTLQKSGNQIIRDVAEKYGLPLIDLEYLVEVPEYWDGEWFSDHIHPNYRGHDAIAEAVFRYLISNGELPLQLR
jgi:lysophospholipase L1-like esterase